MKLTHTYEIDVAEELVDSLPPKIRLSEKARRNMERLNALINRRRHLILVFVVRDYQMGGHGEARKGELVFMSSEAFKYISEHDPKNPLILEVNPERRRYREAEAERVTRI